MNQELTTQTYIVCVYTVPLVLCIVSLSLRLLARPFVQTVISSWLRLNRLRTFHLLTGNDCSAIECCVLLMDTAAEEWLITGLVFHVCSISDPGLAHILEHHGSSRFEVYRCICQVLWFCNKHGRKRVVVSPNCHPSLNCTLVMLRILLMNVISYSVCTLLIVITNVICRAVLCCSSRSGKKVAEPPLSIPKGIQRGSEEKELTRRFSLDWGAVRWRFFYVMQFLSSLFPSTSSQTCTLSVYALLNLCQQSVQGVFYDSKKPTGAGCSS